MDFRPTIFSENTAGFGRFLVSLVLCCTSACDDGSPPRDMASPAGGAGKADGAEGDPTIYDIEYGGYVLEVSEWPDQSAVDVKVDDWHFVVPWDGMTARCPCRTYGSSVLTLELKYLGDGVEVRVVDARLGLEATIEERDGAYGVVLGDGRSPKVGDYLALMAVVDEADRALLDRIAETDLEAYLRTLGPNSDVRLFWHDAEELSTVADWLTNRVYRPPGLG